MAVVMSGVGRTVGDAHGEEGHEGSDEIKAGMGRLRENSQAARGNADDQLEDGNPKRGKQRVERNVALLFLHAFQHRIEFSRGHTAIVSSFCFRAP